MTSITSVTSSYQQSQRVTRKAEESLPSRRDIDFVFIFNVKGINLSGTDKAVAQLLFNATKYKKIVEFTYKQLEQKLGKCQRTIYRSLKKLVALFITEFFRSKVNSLGYREYNVLSAQRVPEFNQITRY